MKPLNHSLWAILRRVLLESVWLLAILSIGLTGGGVLIYQKGTPDVAQITRFPFSQSTIIYDHTGTHELYRVYGEENRRIIPRAAIPQVVRLATIAAEDVRFFHHPGVDPVAIVRAALINMESQRIREGGSTITQQLARTLFLTREQTIKRKILEAVLALKIDRHFDKNTILDLYLNAVPYGANAYGIETAAQTYFGKSAADLTLDEAALLAALPNAPSYYSPYGEHRALLSKRRDEILERLHTAKLAPPDEITQAFATDTLQKILPRKHRIRAPHFTMYVLEELDARYGRSVLERAGYDVTTTLDLDLQTSAEKVIRNGAEKLRERGAENAALAALDPRSGRILAMVGSRGYFDPSVDGQVNVTVEARQPGSAFKPFAYAALFEKGYEPESLVRDAPINFGPDGTGRDYIPRNYDGQYHGVLTLRQALAMSLNIPAVQVLETAGVENTIALARRLGITTLTNAKNYGLALVLGGAEVRPLEMASAFGVFSQEGIRAPAYSIERIIRKDRQVIYTAVPSTTTVLDSEIARRINSILSDNAARTPIFGARSPLSFPPGITVAAKTGTTQHFRDAWTVGYTPQIAVAVWAGNNDNRPMRAGADGIFVAAPLWRDFFDLALRQFPETGFVAYTPRSGTHRAIRSASAAKKIFVDKRSGKRISEEKARKLKKKYVETFTEIPPGEISTSFGPLPLDSRFPT